MSYLSRPRHPILRLGGANIPNNLRAQDVVTKEFLDPTINVDS
ncbi:hypothetical protein ACIBJI_32550 [Nocardia sp. NPDC050408]